MVDGKWVATLCGGADFIGGKGQTRDAGSIDVNQRYGVRVNASNDSACALGEQCKLGAQLQ